MNIVYTDVLVIGGGLDRAAARHRREAPRPRRDHPVAGAAQALALVRGAGRNAGVAGQRDQGAGRQRGRAFRGYRARQRLGRRPARGPDVREHRAQGGPRARRMGRAVEPRARGDREVVINAEKVTITERDEAHGLLAQRDFGGTKKWRTCYVSDGTGPRDALRDERPGDRQRDPRARAHRGDRADPRCGPLLMAPSCAT